MPTAFTIDPSTLYGPNDHHFAEARDADGTVRVDKDGRVHAVMALPGLGPEADALLLRTGRGRDAFLSAKERELAEREAVLREAEERIAAEKAQFAREFASLPLGTRKRLEAEGVSLGAE